MSPPATYILVHGGFHDSRCFQDTAHRLRALGHAVETFDLPGRHAQPPGVTLEDWVQSISDAVDRATSTDGCKPTLVAHSIGGVAATQLAGRRVTDLACLIYVCAAVPIDGAAGHPTLSEAGDDNLLIRENGFVVSADERSISVEPEVAGRAFYQRCPPEVAALFTSRLCAEPTAPLMTPVALEPALGSLRRHWIASTDDHTVPFWLQQRMAGRHGIEITPIDADHCPFLSAPEQFESLLTTMI